MVKEAESNLGLGPHSWEFLRKAGAKGWLCPTWPKQYGGLEASHIDRLIIWDEIAYHGAMEIWAGVRMAVLLQEPGVQCLIQCKERELAAGSVVAFNYKFCWKFLIRIARRIPHYHHM